jgi:hypothetical protein
VISRGERKEGSRGPVGRMSVWFCHSGFTVTDRLTFRNLSFVQMGAWKRNLKMCQGLYASVQRPQMERQAQTSSCPVLYREAAGWAWWVLTKSLPSHQPFSGLDSMLVHGYREKFGKIWNNFL